MFERLAITTALLAVGCNLALVRLEERNAHDEVIARASERARPPRRGGARALASALVATGDPERARDVLLGDYRRGGQLASLVQLADLERAMGRDGVAASHYARVAALDRGVLAGRRDVCTLLDTRAAAWVALAEGAAALDDLDMVVGLCGRDDPGLRRRASAQLATRLERTRRPPTCSGDCSAPTPASALEPAIERARAEGPAALRTLAMRERIVLPPDDVLALLLADIRGQAGVRLVDDDELRAWLGDVDVEALSALVRALPIPEGSYVRLRIERVLGRAPDGGPATPSQRALWLDRASVVEGAVRWRLLAYAGELTSAEHDLVARWRGKPTAEPAGSGLEIVRSPRHWALRAEVTAASHRELLTFARLRDAAEDRDLGLELRREVLRAAAVAGIDGATAALRDEIDAALGWGRPWIALALAEVGTTADLEPWRRAAASGILLAEASCEGPCEADAADVAAIGRVLGEAWVDGQRAALRDLAFGRPRSRPPAGACPALDEVLAPQAESPLAIALDRARTGDEVGLARVLVAAIEADPSLVCAARLAMPLLVGRDAAVSAARLSDFLSHGPALDVGPALTVQATLALLGRQSTRAEHFAIAAAAAGDPRAAWRELARFARRLDARDLEVLSLRELLLQTPDYADQMVRRELVARTVVDGARAWGARDTPAGRESVVATVDEHLARLHPSQRWAERQAVIDAIERLDDDAAVMEVIGRTALASASTARGQGDPMWSPGGLAEAAAERRLAAVPAATEVFADVRRMAPLRAALAEHARDWGLRRRMAVGLATTGSAALRARGAEALLAMATPKSRAVLERLLLERPAALDGGAAVTVVEDDQVLLHLLFAMSLDDALWLRDAVGAR